MFINTSSPLPIGTQLDLCILIEETGEEMQVPAKVVSNFLRENAKLRYIAGLLITAAGVSLLDGARVRALGNLPSRDELLAQLVYLLKGTQSQFVRTLNEIPARFVRTLAALAATKGEE